MARGDACQDLSRWDDGIGLGVATRHMLSVCVCMVYGATVTRTALALYFVLLTRVLTVVRIINSPPSTPVPPTSFLRPAPPPRVSAWSCLVLPHTTHASLVSALFLSSLVTPQSASIPSRHSSSMPLCHPPYRNHSPIVSLGCAGMPGTESIMHAPALGLEREWPI